MHDDQAIERLHQQVVVRGAEPHPMHVIAEARQGLFVGDLLGVHLVLQRLGKAGRGEDDGAYLVDPIVDHAPLHECRAGADRDGDGQG